MVENCLWARGRARRHRLDGLGRREAGGDLGAAQICFDRPHAAERQRRARHSRRPRHLRRAVELSPGAYQMVPVGITVEGANILTRTLITFAQGALRSHPYLSPRSRRCRTRTGSRRARVRARLRRPCRPSRVQYLRRAVPQPHFRRCSLTLPPNAGDTRWWWRQLRAPRAPSRWSPI